MLCEIIEQLTTEPVVYTFDGRLQRGIEDKRSGFKSSAVFIKAFFSDSCTIGRPGLFPNSYCGGRGIGWLSIIPNPNPNANAHSPDDHTH